MRQKGGSHEVHSREGAALIFVTLVFFFCAGLAKVHVKLIECYSEE